MKNFTTKIYKSLPDEAKYIRTKVFVEEQGFKEEFDSIDNTCTHMVMFESNAPCAVVRYCKSGEKYVIGRLAVIKEYRGSGIGAKIIAEAEKSIKAEGGREIVLHSQCRAMPFYEKQGYSPFGEIEYEEYCPHMWMKKELSNRL